MSWYPFNKPLSDVNADDVRALIGNVSENELFEMKVRVPDPDGVDHWANGNRFTWDGKAAIAHEIIALANGQGGTLAIGLEEDDGEPSTAQAICPIPNAADFERQLRQSLNAKIDPPIDSLRSRAIDIDGQGGGVVLFQVDQSLGRPHRWERDRRCHVRRGDEAKQMSMREIQEMTILRDRQIASVLDRFEALKNADVPPYGPTTAIFQFEALVVPLQPLQLALTQRSSGQHANVEMRSSDNRLFARAEPINAVWSEGGTILGGRLLRWSTEDNVDRFRLQWMRDGVHRFRYSKVVPSSNTASRLIQPRLLLAALSNTARWVRDVEQIADGVAVPRLAIGFVVHNGANFGLADHPASFSWSEQSFPIEAGVSASEVREFVGVEGLQEIASDLSRDILAAFDNTEPIPDLQFHFG